MNDFHLLKLAEIVGEANLTFKTGALREFGWEGPLPKIFVAPSTPEQVCEVVCAARDGRWKLAPLGSMTKLRIGGVPKGIDVALSLARLSRVVDYQPADLTISVEAGITIGGMDKQLEANGQMLPLDVPFGARATIGGVIATNSSGSRRLGYGSLRDMVIGTQFVTADGKLVKSGGKVVKNVAGYDLSKLLIGSLGTVAIVTGATFKLFPIQPASVTIICGFLSLQNAIKARNKLLRSPFLLHALDLIDAPAGQVLGQPILSQSPYSLILSSAGPAAAMERIRRDTFSIIRDEGIVFHNAFTGERERQMWSALREMTPAALEKTAGMIILKTSLELSHMQTFLESCAAACSAGSLLSATVARAANGIIYSYLWPDSLAPRQTPEATATSCRAIQAEAARLRGSCVIESCPESIKTHSELWAAPGDDFPIMQRLKAEMDPDGILNPGKLWGRI